MCWRASGWTAIGMRWVGAAAQPLSTPLGHLYPIPQHTPTFPPRNPTLSHTNTQERKKAKLEQKQRYETACIAAEKEDKPAPPASDFFTEIKPGMCSRRPAFHGCALVHILKPAPGGVSCSALPRPA